MVFLVLPTVIVSTYVPGLENLTIGLTYALFLGTVVEAIV